MMRLAFSSAYVKPVGFTSQIKTANKVFFQLYTGLTKLQDIWLHWKKENQQAVLGPPFNGRVYSELTPQEQLTYLNKLIWSDYRAKLRNNTATDTAAFKHAGIVAEIILANFNKFKSSAPEAVLLPIQLEPIYPVLYASEYTAQALRERLKEKGWIVPACCKPDQANG